MKKAPAPTTMQGALKNHKQRCDSIKLTAFLGTENPRYLRTIAALMRRPIPRESLDHEAGASNSPELVAELRRRGLDIPCVRIHFIDRDGRACRPGVYHLTSRDRRKIFAWMAERKKASNG